MSPLDDLVLIFFFFFCLLQIVEKRLDKLKCKDKEVTSKEIIQYLESIKDDQFNNLFKSSLQFNLIEETLDEDNDSLYSSFERKLFPQRQAINPQELLQLIDNDYLNLIQNYHDQEERKENGFKPWIKGNNNASQYELLAILGASV